MFHFQYIPRYGDYKDYETLKGALALDIAQDMGIRHSETVGYGIEVLRGLNYAWLLQGIKLHFEKPMSVTAPLDVSTAVRNMKGVTSERGCIIAQKGEVVAKTIANWFLCDTRTMRPCRIPAQMAEAYGLHDFEDAFFHYEKPALGEAERLYKIKVSPKEIDTNRHLNNYKSAEILMDALPVDFFFRDMSVYYKKSAYLGDELWLCTAEREKGWYVHLETEDGEIAVAAEFDR